MRRHHRLAGQIDASGALRHLHLTRWSHLNELRVANDDRGVLDRGASVADDDPGALEAMVGGPAGAWVVSDWLLQAAPIPAASSRPATTNLESDFTCTRIEASRIDNSGSG